MVSLFVLKTNEPLMSVFENFEAFMFRKILDK